MTAIKLYRVITVSTPHGTFQKGTANAFTHLVVRRSDVASAFYAKFKAGDEKAIKAAKAGKELAFVRDRGLLVSWHTSEKSALLAAASPALHDPLAEALGVYPIEKATKPTRSARTKPATATAAGEQDTQPANPPSEPKE